MVSDSHGGAARVTIGDDGGSGFALAAYSFGFFGPKDETVPILVNGFASTYDGHPIDSYGYAYYVTYEYSNSTVKWADNYVASTNGCIYISTFSNSPCQSDGYFTISSSVQSNTVFVVVLEAIAMGMNSFAYIDPVISVDPSFADANLFTLVSSPGVFTATPEPAYGRLLAATGLCSVIWVWLRGLKAGQ